MNKRDYSWILCPSKSFPGKFYYFNVLTGEAAWSLNDIEKRGMPKSNYIHKVDKWHSYPEPDSPPMDDANWHYKRPDYPHRPVFGQAVFPKYTPYEDPMPLQYWTPVQVPHVYSDLKRPHVQVPWNTDEDFQKQDRQNLFLRFEKPSISPQKNLFSSTPKKWSFDNSNRSYSFAQTQPSPKLFQQPVRNVFGKRQNVQDPMVKRVVEIQKAQTIKKPIFKGVGTHSEASLTNEGKLYSSKLFENMQLFDGPTYSMPNYSQTRVQKSQNIIKEPIFKRGTSFCNSEGRLYTSKSFDNLQSLDDDSTMPNFSQTCLRKQYKTAQSNNKHLGNKSLSTSLEDLSIVDNAFSFNGPNLLRNSRSISDLHNRTTNSKSLDLTEDSAIFEMSTLSPRKRVQDPLSGSMSDLDENDLRYILMAKRKKPSDAGNKDPGNKDPAKGKRISTTYKNKTNESLVHKKRVTFDLAIEDSDEVGCETEQQDVDEVEPSVGVLGSLATPSMRDDQWYIVPDVDTLLEDFDFIDSFVQTDEKCRLLVGRAVLSRVQAECSGDGRHPRRVAAARRFIRRIASADLGEHITLQSIEEGDPELSNNESILNCCLKAIDKKYHVVLITKDPELYRKAKSIDLHCYSVQEIKDGAIVTKPNVSFEIKKVSKTANSDVVNKKLFLQVENDYNPFAKKKSNSIPINCFRKRLFVEENCENKKNDALFLRDNEANVTETRKPLQINTQNSINSADCDDFMRNRNLPPKHITRANQKVVINNESDDSLTSTEISRIETNIRNLDLDFKSNRNETQNKENKIVKKPKKQNRTANAMKLKNINAYTVNGYLKRFQVKNKAAEQRLETRMEEWICSYTQIMEMTLNDLLQKDTSSSKNCAPWWLAEALECCIERYGEHSPTRMLAERLAGLLFANTCPKGKLKATMKPDDFMMILGCGILLIQCLKLSTSIMPKSLELAEGEAALQELLEHVMDPSTDPEPHHVAIAPSVSHSDTQGFADERKNFVKKPAEVLMYLKKHFPDWRSYEPDDQKPNEDSRQVKERNTSIVRTFGRNLNMLTIDKTKTIRINKPAINDEINETNKLKDLPTENDDDTPKIIKSYEFLNSDIHTSINNGHLMDENEKVIRETGAKLIKKLALESLFGNTKVKEIDVEKREKVNGEMLNMIDKMVGNKIDESRNKDISPDCNINVKLTNGTAEIKNITIKKSTETLDDSHVINIVSPKHDNKFSEANVKGPKIIRNIKLIDTFEKKFNNKKCLDLDVLDYNEMDIPDGISDESDIVSNHEEISKGSNDPNAHETDDHAHDEENTQNNNNQNNSNTAQNNDVQVQNNRAQINDNRAHDAHIAIINEQNNGILAHNDMEVDLSNDTTDSGFENESLHAYSLVKTFFSELSSAFKNIYQFIGSSVMECRRELQEDKKKLLHQKAEQIHGLVSDIIDKLKSIIDRESSEDTTLKTMLTSAGVHLAGDKRICKYRQVTMKCLEQAQVLQTALKTLKNLTDEDLEIASTVTSISDVQCINIFE